MRIGILGGTFDPIHNGHLRLALQAKAKLKLDHVIFVPANISPLKTSSKLTAAKKRCRMLALAIKKYPHFKVSDYEIRKGGTSYSVGTLRAFRKKFGAGTKLFFLTGSDSLSQIRMWKDINKIFKLAEFVIAARPGYKMTNIQGIRPLDIKPLDISSTKIRQRMKKGLSIKNMVPRKVYCYIKTEGLYR